MFAVITFNFKQRSFNTENYPKGADGMANCVDHDQAQSYLSLHCLQKPISVRKLGNTAVHDLVVQTPN